MKASRSDSSDFATTIPAFCPTDIPDLRNFRISPPRATKNALCVSLFESETIDNPIATRLPCGRPRNPDAARTRSNPSAGIRAYAYVAFTFTSVRNPVQGRMRDRCHHTTLPRILIIGPSSNPPHRSIRRVLRSDFHKEASPHPWRHNTHTSPFRRPRCGVLWPCLTGNHRRISGLRRRAPSRLLFRGACGLNRYPSFRRPFTDVTNRLQVQPFRLYRGLLCHPR